MSTLDDLKAYQLKKIEMSLYARSLKDFVEISWDIIEPGVTYEGNWHIDAICEHLQAVKNHDITRLIINMPPRHAKSTIISVDFPVWIWASDPSAKFLCGSYSMQLALQTSRKRRMIVESEWFQALYGNKVKMSPDQNAKINFVNMAGGYMTAISTGGTVTGLGANYIISDDPHNAVEIGGRKQETARTWFNESLSTRLNDPRRDCIILVMQRLHEKDITGMLLEMGGWESLILPAEYEGSKYFTSIGWSDPRIDEGEPLWKNRITKEVLEVYKKNLGSIAYAGQYQQRPTPASGGLVKKSWIQHAREFTDNGFHGYRLGATGRFWLEDKLRKFITVDLAISKNTTSDYTCISVWALTPDSELILIDCTREKLDNPEQVKAIEEAYAKHKPLFIAIESVAYQLAIIQQMQQKGYPVRAYNPSGKGDKVARFMSVSVYFENSKIYLLSSVAGINELENELLVFPLGAHDDFCDTCSMAVSYIPGLFIPSISIIDDEVHVNSERHILDDSYVSEEQAELSSYKSMSINIWDEDD